MRAHQVEEGELAFGIAAGALLTQVVAEVVDGGGAVTLEAQQPRPQRRQTWTQGGAEQQGRARATPLGGLHERAPGPRRRRGAQRRPAANRASVAVKVREAPLQATIERGQQGIVAEGRCAPAGRLQNLRQGRVLQPQAAAHLGELMHCRIAAGEERGVRGQRPLRRRDGALEQRRAGGKIIEGRRGRALVAVGGEVVAAQGVEYDEQDVRGGHRQRCLSPAFRRSRRSQLARLDRSPPWSVPRTPAHSIAWCASPVAMSGHMRHNIRGST